MQNEARPGVSGFFEGSGKKSAQITEVKNNVFKWENQNDIIVEWTQMIKEE